MKIIILNCLHIPIYGKNYWKNDKKEQIIYVQIMILQYAIVYKDTDVINIVIQNI